MSANGPEHLFLDAGPTAATFVVTIDGREIGRFSEVAGMQVEVEMDTYSEGGSNGFVHHLPGRMTWPNLVLKRGVTNDDALLAWFNASTGESYAANGKITPTTMAITLLSPSGEFLRSWNVEHALPVRWSGPSLAASAAELPVEELEVAHHGFRTS